MTKTATDSKTATLKQFIGGKWVEGTGKSKIQSINPANTDDVLAECQGASAADAQKALEAAAKAAAGWRKTPAPARARVLDKIVKISREKKEELARLMTREEGKILSEARGEMEKGINLLEWFAG